MNYFVTSQELEEAINKAAENLLDAVSKHSVEMKKEIDKKIGKLRHDLEKKKMLDQIKEEAKRVEEKD